MHRHIQQEKRKKRAGFSLLEVVVYTSFVAVFLPLFGVALWRLVSTLTFAQQRLEAVVEVAFVDQKLTQLFSGAVVELVDPEKLRVQKMQDGVLTTQLVVLEQGGCLCLVEGEQRDALSSPVFLLHDVPPFTVLGRSGVQVQISIRGARLIKKYYAQ